MRRRTAYRADHAEIFRCEKLDWAVVCSAFIVGIALFFEVGLILLVPIIFAIAREAKISPMYMCVPMLSGLLVAHGFLPPHPDDCDRP
jgi:GntP family gluconate:H+ symporter